uniref:ATP-dependent DNA helicase n=1 Tax=Pygocentrus nattereri TaxID=42514 RepID=A0AAR2LLI3_PYGNA
MHSISDRCKGRPKTPEFVEMCLATFASEYRALSQSESSSTDCIKLEKRLGFIKKRSHTDAAVVRYARFSPTKNPEKYYQSILQLFLPHYSHDHLKPNNFHSYKDFYETGFVKFSNELLAVKSIVDSNMARFEKEADSIHEAEEDLERNGPMEDAWAEICPETERERLECIASKSVQDTEIGESNIIPDLLPKETSVVHDNPCGIPKKEAVALLRSLNEKQSEIFYQIHNWCVQKACGENPDPFHVFISGPGGVGKSVLIKAIYYEASQILSVLSENPDEIHVLLTAPTGVSAYNINAATIHTLFSIGTDVKLPYQPIGDEKINSLSAKLGKLEILIIDEISMVDHKLLAYIHGRLRQIKQVNSQLLEKFQIMAVGEFYQLGPVKGEPLYADSVNAMLEHDVSVLKQRETGEGEDRTDLHIYATNEQVDDHNRHMLYKTCSDPVTIHAQDFERVAKTGRLERIHGHHAHVSKTCLTQSLHIGVNARVMLVRNIDVSDGLVNGALGTVNEICKTLRVKKLCFKPGLEKATPIEPEEERVTKSGGIRHQFPVKLAWACTIHKVQGLTVEKAVVSLKKTFAAGQAYVALSRVTSLSGLIIEDFNEKKHTAVLCFSTQNIIYVQVLLIQFKLD